MSSPVRQHQWSSSNWPICMANQHDHTYVHVRLQHPIRVGTCSATHSLGWQSRKLILKAYFDFSQNLAPPKITRHAVFNCNNRLAYALALHKQY